MVGLGTGFSDKVIALLKLSELCDQLCDHFDIDPDLPHKARLMALSAELAKQAKSAARQAAKAFSRCSISLSFDR